ncbi:hypothetical protein BDN70DRAFT_571652 [Pholiota conissans]|uniref:Uncharacterized protein n=1 Tax=Pholiota conissans TaxID=109636 RepID=A0A9P6CM76_9AGAR|nr:hypothetical protein BDN70DRAFT_571652 [Pholiota conissans]
MERVGFVSWTPLDLDRVPLPVYYSYTRRPRLVSFFKFPPRCLPSSKVVLSTGGDARGLNIYPTHLHQPFLDIVNVIAHSFSFSYSQCTPWSHAVLSSFLQVPSPRPSYTLHSSRIALILETLYARYGFALILVTRTNTLLPTLYHCTSTLRHIQPSI